MADFNKALAITGQNEGGLSQDANDRGGFTYAGIASKYWPNWKGWPLVHKILADNGNDFHKANIALKNDSTVQQLVKDFYKQNFWDVNKLDQINDQQIGNNIYDMSVNAGVGIGAKMLQRAAGVKDDGIVGSGTISAVNTGNGETIYNSINQQRKAYYDNIIAKDLSQAKFKNSWYSRIVPYKKS